MAVSNNLSKAVYEPRSIGQYLGQANIKNLLNGSLGSEKETQKFIASLCSAASSNPALQGCDYSTVVSSALLANALQLSLSPQLGLAYIVPFEDRKNNRTVATFILGYKGYIQLAIRSGYYKKINVLAIKEGELKHFDALTEDIDVELIEDDAEREQTPTVGYYAMFEYLTGFRKAIYWSKAKMERHAAAYSKGYAADIRNGKEYTFWSKNFDDMAYKTLLRQLISKWGIMSIDLQKAFEGDNEGMTATGDYFGESTLQPMPINQEQPLMPEEPSASAQVSAVDEFFNEAN